MNILSIILICAALIICLILFVPVFVSLSISENGFITVKYLFFRFKFRLYPKNTSKKGKVKRKKSKEKDKKNKQGFFEKKSDESGTLNAVFEMLGLIRQVMLEILRLFRKTTVKKMRLTIKVAAEDPAQTAMLYGTVCAAAYPVVGLLHNIFNIKSEAVNIYADYSDDAKMFFEYDAVLKIYVFMILGTVFGLVKNILFVKEKAE